jgi:negative regulator of replication initiation
MLQTESKQGLVQTNTLRTFVDKLRDLLIGNEFARKSRYELVYRFNNCDMT